MRGHALTARKSKQAKAERARSPEARKESALAKRAITFPGPRIEALLQIGRQLGLIVEYVYTHASTDTAHGPSGQMAGAFNLIR